MAIKFSILICSLRQREEQLKKLLSVLSPQLTSECEVVLNVDDKQKTVGKKRNELLDQSNGQYVAFVDDDDMVSPDYVSKILTAIQPEPDCCGIEGIYYHSLVKQPQFIYHSIRYDRYYNQGNHYYRHPNHLNPVKLSIAKQAGFKDINACEDGDYAIRVRPMLKTEEYIKGPIYYYYYDAEKSETCRNGFGYQHKNSIGGDFRFEASLSKMSRSMIYGGVVFRFNNSSLHFVFPSEVVHDDGEGHVQKIPVSLNEGFSFGMDRTGEDVAFKINGSQFLSCKCKQDTCRFFFTLMRQPVRQRILNMNTIWMATRYYHVRKFKLELDGNSLQIP